MGGGGRNMRDNVKKKLESNNVNLKKFFVGKGVGGGGGGRNMRDNVKKKLESNNVNLKKFFGGEGWAGKKKNRSL